MGQVATKTLSVVSERTSGTSPSGSLTVSYGYDGLGTLTSIQYPSSTTFTYTLDSLERPTALVDSTNYTWATGAAYNAANQITAATFPSGTQTWIYNTLNQLIQRTTTSGATTRMNMAYNYTAGKNNGQIASTADAVTGETVTYQYDSLKRLVNAASTPLPPVDGTAWSEAYTYDGFGNLTGMTPTGSGSLPTLSVSVNPANNRISPTNILYDPNGNVTQFGPSESLTTMTYDVSNRPVTVNSVDVYAYDPANQRAYFRNSAGTETLYVYGVDGKKLATYTVGVTSGQVSFTLQSQNVYFAGNLLSAEGNAVAADGPSSVRWNAGASHTYYPFGAEYNPTPNNTEKYATYTRDNLTGLDYAMNRYYYSAWGRFMSPDPYSGSANPANPLSWNRYAYVNGDPINGIDPFGLCTTDFTAMLTGPPTLCNTVAAAAWSVGLDTWSTSAAGGAVSGLSQGTTITQVDVGAIDEQIYGQGVGAFFWAQLLGMPSSVDPNNFDWTQLATGICAGFSDKPSALAQCQQGVFALSGGLIGCSGPPDQPCQIGQITINPPNSPQPPQPVVLGSLGLPFAPNPIQPSCQKGFHPVYVSLGNYSCAPNPIAILAPVAQPVQTQLGPTTQTPTPLPTGRAW